MTRSYKNMRIASLLFLLPLSVMAQKKDSLVVVKEFMQVCNIYKQLPLYLDIQLENRTNFMTNAQDTTSMMVSFYIQPGQSYTRFGEVEQLVSDSLALVVSDKARQMILTENSMSVQSRVKAMMGMQMNDSSALEIGKRYKSEKTKTSEGHSSIILTDRNVIYGTTSAKESIEVIYDQTTRIPLEVRTTRRNLLPLQESDFNELKKDAAMEGNLIATGEGRFFLLKEQVGRFIYKEISHDEKQIPYHLSDRVEKDLAGTFVPVKKYEGYRLVIN